MTCLFNINLLQKSMARPCGNSDDGGKAGWKLFLANWRKSKSRGMAKWELNQTSINEVWSSASIQRMNKLF